MPDSRPKEIDACESFPGGAGSEVWNRVYMIAPVKKFGPVGLCTSFIPNKHGGGEEAELAEIAVIWCTRVWVGSALFPFKHSREGFDRFFLPLCLSDLVALSAFSGTDFTSSEAFSDTFHSGQIRSPLSLRIVAQDFVLVSFTYTVDFFLCRNYPGGVNN